VIFVTVGTTIPFEELLAEVDRLAATDWFGEHVVCQAGMSRYRMSHGKQFVERPGIDDLIAESSMVITHGGAGTVLQLLIAQKPFVAFPNPRGAADHQTRFLTTISTLSNISWSRNVRDLERLFQERRLLGPAQILIDTPRAADIIRNALC
jgi:beta-1,4-N-acetylglucosaminyltransferase